MKKILFVFLGLLLCLAIAEARYADAISRDLERVEKDFSELKNESTNSDDDDAASSGDAACTNARGQCTTGSCSGIFRSGLCAGNASRRCCVSSSSPSKPTTTTTNNNNRNVTPARPVTPTTNKGTGAEVGGGEPAIDLNGTKYTAIEGRAGDNRISIRLLSQYRNWDPLVSRGVALTTSQVRALGGLPMGGSVIVTDKVTGRSFTAQYYDGAGTKPDGTRHFEISPALADALGLRYRNSRGNVVDAIAGSERMKNRFFIRRA